MATLIVKWLVNALAIFLVARYLPGIIVPDFETALWGALVLGILNAIVRPVLLVLTLPITILTLGLFTLVLNGGMLLLAASIVPGLEVTNVWWAILGALIISLVSAIGQRFFLGPDGRVGTARDRNDDR